MVIEVSRSSFQSPTTTTFCVGNVLSRYDLSAVAAACRRCQLALSLQHFACSTMTTSGKVR